MVLMKLDTTKKRNQGQANGSAVTRAKVARYGTQWERPGTVLVIPLVAAVLFVNALQEQSLKRSPRPSSSP